MHDVTSNELISRIKSYVSHLQDGKYNFHSSTLSPSTKAWFTFNLMHLPQLWQLCKRLQLLWAWNSCHSLSCYVIVFCVVQIFVSSQLELMVIDDLNSFLPSSITISTNHIAAPTVQLPTTASLQFQDPHEAAAPQHEQTSQLIASLSKNSGSNPIDFTISLVVSYCLLGTLIP